MKYLCLGYLNMKDFDSAPEEEKNAILSVCGPQCQVLRGTGKILEEEALESIARAKTIRPRNGRAWVTDGPFIETREQIGSFFIVEAESIDEAVEVASLHPAALLGGGYGFGIEVRPIQ